MMTIDEAVTELRQSSHEAIDSGKPVTIPFMSPGDVYPQGDIGLVCIADVPAGAKPMPAPAGGQLAPGNTKGSRHIIEADHLAGIEFWSSPESDGLSDIVLRSPHAFCLTHPEHAHITHPPGTYRVVHQQDAMKQRIRD